MINRLYGIKKVFVTNEVVMDRKIYNFMDNETIIETSNWTEIKLSKPGMLQYSFEENNNLSVCNTVLTFDAIDEYFYDGNKEYFKAIDSNGKCHLIGLGSKADTDPKIELAETIGDSASSGNSQSIKITWKNTIGRVYC